MLLENIENDPTFAQVKLICTQLKSLTEKEDTVFINNAPLVHVLLL